ncbi:MAG: glyoxalase/bleomycin resistance/dioxygenase family protein [Acidobacteriota bacterium]
MTDPWRYLDRRELLRRSALMIPALHGGLVAGSAWAETTPAANPQPAPRARHPVEFLELELHCHRLEEQRIFYRDALGLETRLEGADLVVQAGSTRLRFVSAESGSQPMYHFAFMIPENKLDRAVDWMRGRAPLLQRRDGSVVFHFKRWNAHSIYFFDPAGNIAEFIAHHALPTAADGDFSPRDILFACEIGLVAPDLDRLVGDLDSRLGLQPFFNTSDVFAPVGDRHGLFICVKEHRLWLATDLKAEIYPVTATVRSTADDLVELAELPFRVRTRA